MLVKVRVPATSANLGPGFDVAGIALTLYNDFTFELIDEGLEILGCPPQFNNEKNLIYTSFLKAAKEINLNFKGVRITCVNNVPFTRGLGSSSTCIVAGIVGAFTFKNKQEDRHAVLKIANELEGHPDNVAPAIMGGMTTSVVEKGEVITLNIPMKNKYKFTALIPNFTLSTKKARSVLPDSYSKEDAIKNGSHLAILIGSFINGYDEGLKIGFKDYFHQPYRGSLIEGYNEITNVLNKSKDILGCYLSGAGPTIMVVTKDTEIDYNKLIGKYIEKWEVKELDLDLNGYQVEIKKAA